jgi:membrane-bound lytic murein transglycosylase A
MHNALKLFNCIIVLFFTTILLSGCALLGTQPAEKKDGSLYRIPSSQYPVFTDDMAYDSLEHGIVQSLSYLNRLPASREFKFANDTFDAKHIIKSLEMFLDFIKTRPKSKEMSEFIKSNYWVYKSVGSDETRQVLFTGYYEPFLQGSLQKSETYRFPIYARPSDLSIIDLSLFSPKFKGKKIIGRYTNPEFVPYYDRKDIDRKGLAADSTLPLAWVNDKVDLFFLQIQGSGRIFLDNG